jgi:hypothetical protein
MHAAVPRPWNVHVHDGGRERELVGYPRDGVVDDHSGLGVVVGRCGRNDDGRAAIGLVLQPRGRPRRGRGLCGDAVHRTRRRSVGAEDAERVEATRLRARLGRERIGRRRRCGSARDRPRGERRGVGRSADRRRDEQQPQRAATACPPRRPRQRTTHGGETRGADEWARADSFE